MIVTLGRGKLDEGGRWFPREVAQGLISFLFQWTSVVAQMVKNLPAMKETQIQFPGQEDSLEKGMATHSSILAWKIPRTEEPGRLQSQRIGHE